MDEKIEVSIVIEPKQGIFTGGVKAFPCDPALNTECKKSSCQTDCFHTTKPEFAKKEGQTK